MNVLDIISKVNDKVNGILSGNIAIRVEESKWMVRARKDCNLDVLLQLVVFARDCLSSSKRALVVGIADVELVVCFVVLSEDISEHEIRYSYSIG